MKYKMYKNLIPIDDGYIGITTTKCVSNKEDYFYDKKTKKIFKNHSDSELIKPGYKILFATANLNIEDTPIIEFDEATIIGLDYRDVLSDYQYDEDDLKSVHHDFATGYKTAIDTYKYTEEQFKMLYDFVRSISLVNYESMSEHTAKNMFSKWVDVANHVLEKVAKLTTINEVCLSETAEIKVFGTYKNKEGSDFVIIDYLESKF